MIPETFQQLAVAAGLGLLVGLQRQIENKPLGGIRTFALVTILGTLSTLIAQELGGWVVFGSLLVLTAILVITNLHSLQSGDTRPGVTTELALVVMFAVGAYIPIGSYAVAVVVGGAVAVLLEFKERLHQMVERLGQSDIEAIMRFALIALVILPILPDRDFGPFAVLNPFEIWLMVVLIVGISLGGYIALKFFGPKAGTIVGGILGGIISSTATTVSYARRTKENRDIIPVATIVIVVASTIVQIRVLAEMRVVAPELFNVALAPFGLLLAVFVVLSAILWFRDRGNETVELEHKAPSELKPAILFGFLYALVIVGVAATKRYVGNEGLYVVALISGLTDVDAITLSTSQLVERGSLDHGIAWRIIMVATLSNLVFKGGTVAVLGTRRLFAFVGIAFGVALLAGLAILFLWP